MHGSGRRHPRHGPDYAVHHSVVALAMGAGLPASSFPTTSASPTSAARVAECLTHLALNTSLQCTAIPAFDFRPVDTLPSPTVLTGAGGRNVAQTQPFDYLYDE